MKTNTMKTLPKSLFSVVAACMPLLFYSADAWSQTTADLLRDLAGLAGDGEVIEHKTDFSEGDCTTQVTVKVDKSGDVTKVDFKIDLGCDTSQVQFTGTYIEPPVIPASPIFIVDYDNPSNPMEVDENDLIADVPGLPELIQAAVDATEDQFPGDPLAQDLAEVLVAALTPPAKIAFVTSATYTGDFGGFVGGNAICQGHADGAGLSGTFKAWLSNNLDSPSSRFTQATVPYKRVDGVTIAVDWADLTDGNLIFHVPLNIDEFGSLQMDPMDKEFAWTNTSAFGMRATPGAHCSSWTSTAGVGQIGNLSHSAGGWTFFGLTQPSCSQMHHLYCFEQ